MVSGDEAEDAVQPFQHGVGFGGIAPGEIAQDDDLIPGTDLLVPAADHIFRGGV